MANFVLDTLETLGIDTDTWVTLDSIIQRIDFISDGYVAVDPRSKLFYFDSTYNIMYIKSLTGEFYTYDASKIGTDGYIGVTISTGATYLVKEAAGGLLTDELGKIHSYIPFDFIIQFHNEHQNPELILNNI